MRGIEERACADAPLAVDQHIAVLVRQGGEEGGLVGKTGKPH